MNHGSVTRAPDGCWTCKVRRKKCDKDRPTCRVCSALLITCHYSQDKPEWMDGGEKQRDMVEQLKWEVKDKAPFRHSLSYAQIANESPPELVDAMRHEVMKTFGAGGLSSRPLSDGRPRSSNAEYFQAGQSNRRFADEPSKFPSLEQQLSGKAPYQVPTVVRSNQIFVVFYLDYYFPFLFPFYQPPILDGGRAWVVDFMTDSQAMEQTTLCLSSYFFSLALETTDYGHEMCKKVIWENLQIRLQATFSMLQEDLRSITGEVTTKYQGRAVQVMGSILLLQRFETAIWSFENCQAHLNAAITLFKQLLEGEAATDPAGNVSRFEMIMSHMGQPSWPRHYQSVRILNSEQAAFRFFSALLIVDDIIASTVLGEEPKLYEYHNSLLSNCQGLTDPNAKAPINLAEVMGCQNWVMLQIGNIAALDSWKKRHKTAGDLDMMELVQQATTIKSMLLANLARVEVAPPSVPDASSNLLSVFYPWKDQPATPNNQSVLVTRIWAHAALIYLSIVVSGWQPANPQIRQQVEYIVELISHRMPSPALLRTVAWPFCVAGCLADPTQEPLFRSMVEGLRPLGFFGTVRKAFDIMENVWRSRETVDVGNWDLAACFRRPGHLVLLV